MRTGHSRPVGTTWRMRLYQEGEPWEPGLGDYVFEQPESLERGFRVVGVEETSKPNVWNLLLERIAWPDLLDAVVRDAVCWGFVRRRRK